MLKKYIFFIMSLSFFFLLSACHTETVTDSNTPTTQTAVDPVKASKINMELGLSYLKQDNMPRAKQKLLLAFKQNPSAQTYGALAYYYEKTGDIAEAEKNYVAAIAQNPEAGAPHNNYGAFLCRQKTYEAADIEFQKAITDPNYVNTASALENAGLCAMLSGNETKAEDYFTRALQQNPKLTLASQELAKIKAKQS